MTCKVMQCRNFRIICKNSEKLHQKKKKEKEKYLQKKKGE